MAVLDTEMLLLFYQYYLYLRAASSTYSMWDL